MHTVNDGTKLRIFLEKKDFLLGLFLPIFVITSVLYLFFIQLENRSGNIDSWPIDLVLVIVFMVALIILDIKDMIDLPKEVICFDADGFYSPEHGFIPWFEIDNITLKQNNRWRYIADYYISINLKSDDEIRLKYCRSRLTKKIFKIIKKQFNK